MWGCFSSQQEKYCLLVLRVAEASGTCEQKYSSISRELQGAGAVDSLCVLQLEKKMDVVLPRNIINDLCKVPITQHQTWGEVQRSLEVAMMFCRFEMDKVSDFRCRGMRLPLGEVLMRAYLADMKIRLAHSYLSR